MKVVIKFLLNIYLLLFIVNNSSLAENNSILKNLHTTFDFDSIIESSIFDEIHKDASTIDDEVNDKDIEISAQHISFSKTGSTNLSGYGNLRTEGKLINFDKGILIAETGKDFLLNLDNDIKINNSNSNIIYGKYLLYSSTGALHMQNIRIIKDKISLIAKDMTNEKDGFYLLRNALYTNCNVSPTEKDEIDRYLKNAPSIVTKEKEWNGNKKRSNDLKLSIDDPYADLIIKPEIIEKINYDNIPKNIKYKELENNFDNILNKYRWSEWRMSIESALYNQKTGDATFKNIILQIFNIPVFALPSFSINLKYQNKAKTGFLMPRFVLTGRNTQLGITVPWYLRISHNKDLLITANIFESLTNKTTPGTNDSNRIMASNLIINYNQLISKKNGMLSKFSLKGSFTNETQIIDYNTKGGILLSNGTYQTGYRGHFRSKGIFSISPTVTIVHNFLYISDPNYSFLYLRKFLPYHTNVSSIQDVRDRSFNKIEILSWTPMLLNYITATAPSVVLQGRSFFRTKKDIIGGSFFIDNRANYLTRSTGFNRLSQSTEVGYNIKTILFNSLISFNNSFRTNTYDTSNGGSSLLTNTSDYHNNINALLFGTYNQLLQNYGYAASITGSGFGASTLAASQILISHPIYKIFKYGTLIIDPMISWQNNYGSNYGFFSNENSFASRLSFDNLFQSSIMGGVDGFVNGSRISFGTKINFMTKNGYKITVGGGLMETISNFGNNYFLQKQSGIYDQGLSNYVGMASLIFPNSKLSLTNNHRIDLTTGNILESYTTMNFAVIDNFLTISLGHTHLNKNILFVQQLQNFNTQLLNLSLRLNITNNLLIILNASKSLSPISLTSLNRTTGDIKTIIQDDPLLFLNIVLTYQSGCVDYNLQVTQTTVAGFGTYWYYGFSVNGLRIPGFSGYL